MVNVSRYFGYLGSVDMKFKIFFSSRNVTLPDTDGEHVQDPLPLQPAHQHDDP